MEFFQFLFQYAFTRVGADCFQTKRKNIVNISFSVHLICNIWDAIFFFFFFNFLSKYQFGSDLTFSALRKKTTKKAWLYFFFNFLLLFEHLPNLISILKFKQLKSFSSPKYSLPSQQDSDDNFPLTTTNKSFSYK